MTFETERDAELGLQPDQQRAVVETAAAQIENEVHIVANRGGVAPEHLGKSPFDGVERVAGDRLIREGFVLPELLVGVKQERERR